MPPSWARAEYEIAGEAGFAADMLPRLHLTLIELDDRRVKILWSKLAPKISALLPGRITVQIIAGDFLQLEAPEREALGEVDVVVMNPPFSLPGDRSAWWTHLRHALSLVGAFRRAQATHLLARFGFRDVPALGARDNGDPARQSPPSA